MRTPVETYRGVDIFRTRLVLCLPAQVFPKDSEWYEAQVGGWLYVGSLERVKQTIDDKLGPPPEPAPGVPNRTVP